MQPRIHCELMKVIATEGEKLLLDWTPPPTCPLFLAKNAQCGGDVTGNVISVEDH